MPIIKHIPIYSAPKKLLSYAANEKKSEKTLITGLNCSSNAADAYVVVSHISEKSSEKIKSKAKAYIKSIEFSKNREAEYKAVSQYNSFVMGIHNYYSMASCVSSDFRALAYGIKTSIKIRLQDRVKKADGRILPKYAAKHYGKSKEIRFVGNAVLLPIAYVQHRPPIHKEKKINKYTKEGRTLIHKTLEKVDINIVHAVMRNPIKGESVEYNDNRISLYVAQGGKCAVLNRKLSIEDIHCHHIIPRSKGGKDNYTNLMILDKEIHKLIHATNKETILICLRKEKLNNSELQKVNKLRILAGNEVIEEQYLSMCFEQ